MAPLKEHLLEIVSKSSIHGLPNIFTSEFLVMKVVWTLVFLAAIGYSSNLTIEGIIDYLNFNVLIGISYDHTYDVEFPAVTFCNLNALDYSNPNLIRLIERYEAPLKANESFLANLQNIKYTLGSFRGTLQEISFGLDETFKLDNTYRAVGLWSLEQMLISCMFNGKACNASQFWPINLKEYGNCFTFNSGKTQYSDQTPILNTAKSGQAFGLSLELFVGLPEKQPFWVSTLGAIIGIHNKSTRPLFSEEGIKLKPGQETNLMFNRVQHEKLSSPFSHCVDDALSLDSFDSQEYRNTFTISKSYRQNLCIQLCSTTFLQKNNTNNQTIFANYDLRFTKSLSYCLEKCPEECHEISFETNPYFSRYPNDLYGESLIWTSPFLQSLNLTVDKLAESILSVNLNYGDQITTTIFETAATSFPLLLANIGGQLGLFLGMSFLSFIELLEMIYIAIKHACVHSFKPWILTKLHRSKTYQIS